MTDHKIKIIADAIDAREQEIALYEVNIANFQHIIAAIPDGDELQDFRDQVRQRLDAERREMRKATLVLDALRAQG